MRKIITLFAVLLLALGMTGAAAMADDDGTSWDDGELSEEGDSIAESEPLTVSADDIKPDVEIALSGDSQQLTVGEAGAFWVTVTNKEESEGDLDSWKLGLSVTNIGDLSEITIEWSDNGSFSDIERDDRFQVELDEEDDILWVLGFDEDSLEAGDSTSEGFRATFHKSGEFTGTAYVVDTSE